MKRPMTKEIAHEIGLGVWAWRTKTNKHKRLWPDWKQYKDYFRTSPKDVSYCAYCEYSQQQRHDYHGMCNSCPIYNSYGFCQQRTYLQNWLDARYFHKEEDMSLYASRFLKQLEAIDVNKPWDQYCLKDKNEVKMYTQKDVGHYINSRENASGVRATLRSLLYNIGYDSNHWLIRELVFEPDSELRGMIDAVIVELNDHTEDDSYWYWNSDGLHLASCEPEPKSPIEEKGEVMDEGIKELLDKYRKAYAVTEDIYSKMDGRVIYYVRRGYIGKGKIKGLQAQSFITLYVEDEQSEEFVTVLEESVFDTAEEAIKELWGE